MTMHNNNPHEHDTVSVVLTARDEFSRALSGVDFSDAPSTTALALVELGCVTKVMHLQREYEENIKAIDDAIISHAFLFRHAEPPRRNRLIRTLALPYRALRWLTDLIARGVSRD